MFSGGIYLNFFGNAIKCWLQKAGYQQQQNRNSARTTLNEYAGTRKLSNSVCVYVLVLEHVAHSSFLAVAVVSHQASSIVVH